MRDGTENISTKVDLSLTIQPPPRQALDEMTVHFIVSFGYPPAPAVYLNYDDLPDILLICFEISATLYVLSQLELK